MRVYLFSLLLFSLSFFASANSCEERVLRKYNADFHAFLENEFKENSNLELFKTIGFLGKSTAEGYKMVLNLSLKGLASEESLKSFEGSVRRFVESKARYGSDFQVEKDHLSFYPKEEGLPCVDKSLFLDGQRATCSIDEVRFDDGQIGELKSFLNQIFDKVAQLELIEANPNTYSLKKDIEVLVDDELVKGKEVKLNVSGGVCDMGSSLKKKFSCTIVGGESMTLKLAIGDLTDELTLKINQEMSYKLNEIDGSKNRFQVQKLSLNKPMEVLPSSSFEVLSEKCSVKNDFIECSTDGVSSYVLKVIPEGQSEKTLFADIFPDNGFELKVKTDSSAQYKLVSAHVYVQGSESGEELKKVSFSENENCSYISTQRKILKCKKTLTPYSLTGIYSGPETIEKSIEIGTFSKFSLELEASEVNSLTQIDKVNVLGDGGEISPATYKDLGLSIKIKNKSDNEIEYSKENASLSSKRGKKAYSYQVELLHNSRVSDTKKIQVKKYVGGDNYFFDIIKKNRQCHFKLMKFENESDFKSVGQVDFLKNLMKIKVDSRRGSCSSVQQKKDSVQIFCAIGRDKLKEEVTVKLLSNGSPVRTVRCVLLNEDYYDEEEEEESRQVSSSGSSSIFTKEMTDSLTSSIPDIMSSMYQTQQPTFYNPLMYGNYGYSPYYSYTPGYYQSPGLWNTMYMFNPATY